ncbi:retropepsin-like aspartic protease [Pyxidicoccus xibeiensis]|uniref:retropepsin-like aspartic protease n=1 Tax=Pyxidicoccus xibeiensis TaxID=2906759 RepID=UPI0020A76BA7|nr:retropepsin-like aspartic protease [Pyxidicoccus xibeiensis]MCP3141847.1 aspartyl protease family protein [Pyxidicoccus xibeiensis]
MKRLTPVLLALVLVLVPGSGRTEALEQLIARHLAWRGGEAYSRLESVHVKGRLAMSGMQGTKESWSHRDGRLREDTDLGVLRGSRAIIPTGSWMLNPSGQVEDAAPTDARDARHRVALDFGAALRGEGGAKRGLQPREERDGRAWEVVRVTFGDEDRYDLFLDGDTGALHGVRIREDNDTRFVRLGDWRQVKGVRLPFLEEELTDSPDSDSRLVVETLEVNVPLPASLFERPVGALRVSFAEGRHSTGFIPFEFFNENRVYIPARVNGRQTQVLLDSGAEMTVVDAGHARELGLKTQGQLTAVGSGGQAQAQLASGVDIVIGDLRLSGLTVAVIDLAEVARQIGHPLPIILGKEAFNPLVVDVDFPNRRVAFHEASRFKAPPGAVRLPLVESTNGHRAVHISIEGRPAIPVLFDVGNAGALSLFPSYWQQARLLEGRRTSKTLSGAVGGLRERDVATLKHIRVAGFTLKDVPTVFDDAGQSVSASDRYLGNLGLAVLGRFRMMTDYANDTLLLVPDARALRTPFLKDRSGLIAIPSEGRLEVKLVAPGSPAAAAGWRAGEEIVAIDGQKIGPGYAGTELARWRYRPAGQTVALTLKDGSERRLTLKDYY